jgi:AcrR family transcriptional regulator
MPVSSNPTRQRLIHAALELFAAQGVTETTTRQIAESAGVNEVTLFRQFGNKHGLLLAVIEEAAVFTQLGQTLVQQATPTSDLNKALKDYATACLQALEGVPEMVRSVVGEAGQFPSENREALGRGFTQANRYVAEYFAKVIRHGQLHTHLPAEKLASLLNNMLLGYAVLEFTSEFHHLWQNREDFLESLVTLFLRGAVSSSQVSLSASNQRPCTRVADLPSKSVHAILQAAKKRGLQEYALVYVLFGAGLSAAEIAQLQRSHYLGEADHGLLQVTQGFVRQVPLNQWILGKRYGSYSKNPLMQWLKSRRDNQSALFLNASGQPITETEIRQQWQDLVQDFVISTPHSRRVTPAIEQAQQTWCVEMLMRGMTLENLQILTGWERERLEPYAQRAKEKAAIEQAIQLDRVTKD